ncbi:MAG: GNAT family N-acetyltransferase [Halanaeroarchaeum sp.]
MAELAAESVRSVAELNENQWNNVVAQSDQGTLFHRYEWVEAIESGFDVGVRHAVVEKNGNPIAIMPNFLRELPLPDGLSERLPVDPPLRMASSASPGFGGPLVISDEQQSLDLLFDALETSIGRHTVFHRLQSFDLTSARYGQYLESRGYNPSFNECLFLMDLEQGWETIRENMDKERRKDLRTAREQDYSVTVAPLTDELDATYDAYVGNMDRVDGVVLPRDFLERVAAAFDERVLVFTAIVNGVEVGRYVHLLDDEASVLHHWLSAVPDAANYEYHPSELLHARAIQFGVNHGFDEYNFGKTGAHFDNSVFEFKQKYGARAVPTFTMEKGYSTLAWPLFKFGRTQYRKRSVRT